MGNRIDLKDLEAIRKIVRKHADAIYNEIGEVGCAYQAETSKATLAELIVMHIAAVSDAYQEGEG